MTARETVTAALQAVVPEGIRVLPYARSIDPPSQTTVMVRVDTVTPDTGVPSAWRRYGFTLILVSAKSDPTGPADDELDNALEDVLHAIESDDSPITWSRVERGTFQDSAYPAYQITLDVPFTRPAPA